ncbi:cytochrome c maturation protein CcmE [Ramlibacter monticola]|uniref:Cytochrome c-type biogenesis protein CcmE n=1 Tax=Ramlibacter monticola TaxID=1926872 RepID=A0A936YZB5_9BURK|nr:cytochrome c maturation protein CcmE [Ramlibacter monticola]MBL0390730.1 cytochrome c maturation protein CcmE [Ramlibacter monticola]
MKNWKKRGAIVLAGVAAVGVASALVLNALNSNIALYITPTEVIAGKAPEGRAFRIGGLVKEGSLQRKDLVATFVMTDTVKDVTVAYKGLLPDLFKEGKGAVVQGKLDASGQFVASEVLAKHDENYMPAEAKDAIDKARKVDASTKHVSPSTLNKQ